MAAAPTTAAEDLEDLAAAAQMTAELGDQAQKNKETMEETARLQDILGTGLVVVVVVLEHRANLQKIKSVVTAATGSVYQLLVLRHITLVVAVAAATLGLHQHHFLVAKVVMEAEVLAAILKQQAGLVKVVSRVSVPASPRHPTQAEEVVVAANQASNQVEAAGPAAAMAAPASSSCATV